jgi:hypothetical protein
MTPRYKSFYHGNLAPFYGNTIGVRNLYYLGNIAVNYHVKKFYNIGPRWQNLKTAVIYRRKATLP